MTPRDEVGELAQQAPGVVRLAEEVSLAVQVDPALLRRARLDLATDADAGTEADLWLSPLVRTRSPAGFVLVPELAAELRRRLAEDPDRLARARARVERAHAHLPPALRVEEELLWLSVRPDAGAPAEMEERLQSAVAAFVRDGREGIAHWAARALPALPPHVQALEPARMLQAGARLRLERDGGGLARLDEDPGTDAAGWMVPRDFPSATVQVRLMEDGIELAAQEGALGHPIELPATDPLLVSVEWRGYPAGGREPGGLEESSEDAEAAAPVAGWISLGHRSTVRVPGPVAGGVRLRTLRGNAFDVRPAAQVHEPRTTPPVFISYPRDTAYEHAFALFRALGGEHSGLCFFDREELAPGDPAPPRVLDALLGAHLVVVLADPAYFARRYCVQEYALAIGPALQPNAWRWPGKMGREDAWRGIVLALPEGKPDPALAGPASVLGDADSVLGGPDSVLGEPTQWPLSRQWPRLGDAEALAALVRETLMKGAPSLRERYQHLHGRERRALAEAESAIPAPMRIGSVPFVPAVGLPLSLRDTFVGRADALWGIHSLLVGGAQFSHLSVRPIAALTAAGGFGKTRLALEYLYRLGPRSFPGGLFWIDAERDVEEQLYEVLRALQPDFPPPDVIRTSSGGVAGAVRRALESRPRGPQSVLFVIDNVPEPVAGGPPHPLETWCPVVGEAAVLVTSRARVAAGSGGSIITIPLDSLSADHAIEVLTRSLRGARRLPKEEWREIAEWVGFLPLALELLNRALASGSLTPAELRELSRAKTTTQLLDQASEMVRRLVPSGMLPGISEAFSLSYHRLEPKQQRAARLLAWMAPAPIPQIVLDQFGRETLSSGTHAELRARSFLSTVSGTEHDFSGSTMHRVLADFLLGQSHAPGEEFREVASVLGSVIKDAAGTGESGSRRVRACAPAAVAVLSHVQRVRLDSADSDFVLDFGTALGREFRNWGMPEATHSVFLRTWIYGEMKLGPEHPSTVQAMHSTALAVMDRGDYPGAQDLLERVLETARRISGDEHPDTIAVLNSLAQIRRARGDLVGARELQERVLHFRRRRLGEEHPETLAALDNLAEVVLLLGDVSRAQKLQERVLEARRRILGDEHPGTLASMNNLALAYGQSGDARRARGLLERVLYERRRLLGDEHPDVLASLNNLAVVHGHLGDLEQAQESLELVLQSRRRVLGDEHPDALIATVNLADVRGSRGDLAGARALLQEVIPLLERVLGVSHPETLQAVRTLARVHRSLRDWAGAQELEERLRKAGVPLPDAIGTEAEEEEE